jgi:hypothetical protein
MNKEDEKDQQQTVNQYAMIWMYNAHVEHQYNYGGGMPFGETAKANADDEKRERLMATNTVIRTQTQSGKQTVDLLRLYKFIDRYFASEIIHKYEWYALRRFLEENNLLRECDNEQFAEQMNNKEWFGSLEKRCEANEMNYYNYLNSVHPEKWVDTEIQLGSRATKRSVSNVYKTYSNLKLYKEQIIGI